MKEQIAIISLWRPWADWVALGWKTIESRTHERFASLAGERIGIQASLSWDSNWQRDAGPFLSAEQIAVTQELEDTGGTLVCTVLALKHRALTTNDSRFALIDCEKTRRWGLVLRDVEPVDGVIAMRGQQGIWRVPAVDLDIVPAPRAQGALRF